ncbi:M23 family metallopeptidase [uncultured Phascolarctobacterium sp.]|uniref:M23 family metallopeptidase n=1 Tax=uncultured Phascolarctobacterium sp. TaxID=512296 RepID=UPI0015B168FC|nr:M23 family metallopeptidase [uncultured Phascolarctobacterium sp.]
MEEKDLQKQEEYTFTAGPKVYHFTARRFKMLVSVALAGVICMVGALGYMGYNFYQFRQERADFLEYQSKKGELEAQLQSLLEDNEKMLRDMSEITTLETKLRRALIRDTDSAKLGSDLGPQTENAATNTPRYLGQGGPANLGVKEMAAVLTAQNKNMEQQIDEKKTSMSELLSELEGRNNKRSIFPDLWPTKGGTISSPYGGRSGPIGGGYDWHPGVDIAVDFGEPVYASAMGTVEVAGWNGGYGRYVRIDHGNGYETAYGHMSGLAVASGQSVRKGEIIGFVGSSGYSTGPHVHFEVFVDGQNVDPMYMLKIGQKLNK